MLPLILSQKLHSLRATSGYHYLVSGTISPPYRGTFQLSLTVLLRYRSWEVFRIRSYCLPHSDPISNGPYSRKKDTNASNTWKNPSTHDLRDYHPLRFNTIPDEIQPQTTMDSKLRLYTTFPHMLPRGIRFVLCRFRSPLLTTSQYCFLFLHLLRCFNSVGSQSSTE